MGDTDRHRNKLVVGIRGIDKKLRDDARNAAKAAGYSGLSDAVAAFLRWLARRPGARTPNRPDAAPGVATHLLGELETAVDALYEQDPAKAKSLMGDVSCFESDWWASHQ